MDIGKFTRGLQGGLDLIHNLAPLAKTLGGAEIGAVASIGVTLASIGANVAKRIEEGTVVATTREAAVIRAINTELGLANDDLAEHIAKS